MENTAKKPSLWQEKIKPFFEAHENIRQIIVYTLVSLICFAIEYISFTLIELCIKDYDEPFKWFLFSYDHTRTFIAFLVSNILAQTATFVLNRKKTFKATNNVVVSGIMFAIIMICIILLNTYLGGIITRASANSMIANGTDAAVAETVGGYAGKLVGSFTAFVLSFLGNKFLVMRNWGKSANLQASEYVFVREPAFADGIAADMEEPEDLVRE